MNKSIMTYVYELRQKYFVKDTIEKFKQPFWYHEAETIKK